MLLDDTVGHVGRNAGGEEIYSGLRWFAMTGYRLSNHSTKLTDTSVAFLAMAV